MSMFHSTLYIMAKLYVSDLFLASYKILPKVIFVDTPRTGLNLLFCCFRFPINTVCVCLVYMMSPSFVSRIGGTFPMTFTSRGKRKSQWEREWFGNVLFSI
uniref:Uncharacterized protein n=1 Tax=Cacopsylla melanoneura TaxID=428564 RepID=A0A8D8X8M4_9HEMI